MGLTEANPLGTLKIVFFTFNILPTPLALPDFFLVRSLYLADRPLIPYRRYGHAANASDRKKKEPLRGIQIPGKGSFFCAFRFMGRV